MGPTDDVVERLASYVRLVADASRLTNLTGFRGEEAFVRDGVFHALSLLPLAEGEGAVIDVGSGVGLPGMVWAIANPGRPVTLSEMRQLRVRFLEAAVRELDLSVEVVRGRAEALGHTQRRESFQIGVARAVGPLPYLAEAVLPLLSVGGRAIFPKGPSQRAEIDAARDLVRALGGRLRTVPEPAVLGEGRAGFVAVIEKAAPTPLAYPRSVKHVGGPPRAKV